MDLNAYLHRVGMNFPSPPSLEALRTLHRQHLLSVPFESLSIHSGEKIILDPALQYGKIVVRRRGGFCCENNGLFLWVLQELGYRPQVLSARVRNSITGIYGPPYDHMLLTVELDEQRWLCDVGFGEGLLYPIPLKAGWEEEQENGTFRLRVEADDWYLERKEDGDWRGLYVFTLEERKFEEFRGMCEYHQTSPSSPFFCKSFCSLLLPGGRLTYMGHKLISTKYTEGGGSVKTTQDLTEDQIPELLREKFGIVLSGKLIPKDEDILPPPSA
ncbi:arylamine N-acetyltransferase, pineal gland isozyme NAT-3-like [Rhinophrynus dorsalis]